MSSPATNPYSSQGVSSQPVAASPQPSVEAIRPLYEAAWWIKLLAWSNIVIGGIYCLTIVGIVFGWLPIWIGFLLKGAAEKITYGYETKNLQSIYDSCKDLKTVFVIVGVLMLINVAILALYALAVILMIVVAATSSVSSMN